MKYVYGKLGVSLPHYTVSQYAHGRAVSRSSLRPGDLVFFYGLNHVGIYAGGGEYIHAPRSGTTVRWSSLASRGGFYGARASSPPDRAEGPRCTGPSTVGMDDCFALGEVDAELGRDVEVPRALTNGIVSLPLASTTKTMRPTWLAIGPSPRGR